MLPTFIRKKKIVGSFDSSFHFSIIRERMVATVDTDSTNFPWKNKQMTELFDLPFHLSIIIRERLAIEAMKSKMSRFQFYYGPILSRAKINSSLPDFYRFVSEN